MSTTSTYLAAATEPIPRWWPWVRAALFLVILASCGLLLLPTLQGRPIYQVSNGQIMARGVQAQTVIPKGTPVTLEQIGIRRKIVGSATPGYTVGRFDLIRYGTANLYTDGTRRALVFHTTPRVTVLTPADPEGMLRAWRAGETRAFRPAQSATLSMSIVLPLLLLLPLLIVVLYSPRMVYRWEPDALVVKTALSQQRFPIGVTRAALTHEGLGIRLFGTGTPGYYTGTFSMKSAGGGRVQAYATTARPSAALLLQLGGRTYYLTPADPQAALEQFQAR